MKKKYYILLIFLITILVNSCGRCPEMNQENNNYMMVGGTKYMIVAGYQNNDQIWLISEGLSFVEYESGKFKMSGIGSAFAILDDYNDSPVSLGTHKFSEINGGVFLGFNFDEGEGFGNPLSGDGYCTIMLDQTEGEYTIVANGLYWQNNMQLLVNYKGKLISLGE